MKLGEIKVEAMKLMHLNGNTAISPETLPILERDGNLRDYLIAMPGCINRCFGNIENKRILPVKSYEYTPTASDTGAWIKITVPGDYYAVSRVVAESDERYDPEIDYVTEGEKLVVPSIDGAKYRILYYPTIPRVSAVTGDATEIAIPDRIAALIPLYIKGDLYVEDEPGEAAQARNLFEAAAEEISYAMASKTGRVQSVYSGGMSE